LKPVSAEVGTLNITDYTLLERVTENDTDSPMNVKYIDATTLENSQTTSWSNTSKVVVSEKIGLTLGYFGSDTSVSFEQDWEQGGTSSHKTTLGSQVEYDLVIPAHNRQTITMLGATGNGQIVVTYDASLSGYVFCNYSNPYALPGRDDTHHFYAVLIESLLAQSGISNSIQVKQTISLSSYKWTKTTFVNQFLAGPSANGPSANGPSANVPSANGPSAEGPSAEEAQVLAVADVNKTMSAG
jgi:hypothetical protein